LCRGLAIFGDHGPAVRQKLHISFAGVDHGFDGEGHTGLKGYPGAGCTIVQDLRVFMEAATDPVTAVLLHHRVTVRLDELLDRMPDVAQVGAWSDQFDPLPHGLLGDIDQALAQNRGIPNKKHLAGITVKTVLDHRDVDVDDVAVLKNLIPWDPVADLMVDRGADRFRETPIVQWGRDGLLHVDDVSVADAIQFFGTHAGPDMIADHLEHVRGQPTGNPHFLDLVGGLYDDGHGCPFCGIWCEKQDLDSKRD
jgi:hypothetical protein